MDAVRKDIPSSEADYYGAKENKACTQALLHLCSSLKDKNSVVIQQRINEFVSYWTQSEFSFIISIINEADDDSEEYPIQILDQTNLIDEAKLPAAFAKHFLRLPYISNHPEGDILPELSKYVGRPIFSILTVPVVHNDPIISFIVCTCNKDKAKNATSCYSESDVDTVKKCCDHISGILANRVSYENSGKHLANCQSLLAVARNLLTHLDNMTILLKEIMLEAKKLIRAERCSLFLIDAQSEELVAKVFDDNGYSTPTEDNGMGKEVRIPMTQGILGYVATTGQLLNIKDAYSHPLFYRGMDEMTGFKSRNILCFPIIDKKNVIGVAQLCNKLHGSYFTKSDEESAMSFSVYCALSIFHGLMYKKIHDMQTRNLLSNELMMYHMKVDKEEERKLATEVIPSPYQLDKNFSTFEYIPRDLSEDQTPLAVLSMMEHLGFIKKFRINRDTLARFILLVRKGYRNPPYHNWRHAFTVSHFCYVLLLKLQNYEDILTDLECLTLFIACLCHDLDHRGTTNSFQVVSNSVLASLYSSEGSVMERHHFAQAMCVLNSPGANIFETLSELEYTSALDILRNLILATDLAHHLRTFSRLKTLCDKKYDKNSSEHHHLLLYLIITSCDLSDQTKDWKNSIKVAKLVYQEFFSQGDLEKAMGRAPSEMMDREKAFVPELQLQFLDEVVYPVYSLLHQLFPVLEVPVHTLEVNRRCWERARNFAKIKNGQSFEFLDEEPELYVT